MQGKTLGEMKHKSTSLFRIHRHRADRYTGNSSVLRPMGSGGSGNATEAHDFHVRHGAAR